MLAILVPFLLGMFQAEASSDYHSPKTAALAGAGHALPSLTDSIWMNPGSTSFTETYNIHLGYNSYHGPDDSEPKGRVYGVALLDGRNEFFQAGVGYVKRSDGALLNIGASKAFVKKFGVGIGTKYGFDSATKASAKDLYISTVYQVLPGSAISLIGQNLISNQDAKAWGMEREVILGLKYGFEQRLAVYLDPHFVLSQPGSGFGYEAGLELGVMADLFLRIGKSKNSLQPHLSRYGRGYGFGAGWIAPKISLDFAIHRTLEPIMTTNTLFSATVFY